MPINLENLSPKQILIILFAAVVLLSVVGYTNHYYRTVTQETPQSPSPTAPSAPAGSITPQVSITSSAGISQEDMEAKNSLLLRTLHSVNQSGVVYKSPNVEVEYIATDNLFEAQIFTSQIAAAKIETENWFQLEGINQKGVCKLLFFYLNPVVKANLPQSQAQVNLLPDGC
jgi:cytoskeletal protein RodZ